MMRLETITDRAALADLAQPWDALVLSAPGGSPVLSHDFILSWLETYGRRAKLHVTTVWDGDALVGLAPLHEKPTPHGALAGLRELRFIGGSDVNSLYLDFLVAPGREHDVLPRLLEGVHASPWCRLRLERLRADACVLPHLQTLCCGRAARRDDLTDLPCAILPLPDTMAELEAGMDYAFIASFKRKLKRRMKKFQSVRMVDAIPEQEIAVDLEHLFRVHTDRWRLKGRGGEFQLERKKDFYHRLLPRWQAKGWLVFNKLLLNEEPHVLGFGALFQGEFYYMQVGCSPLGLESRAGMLHLHRLVESLLGKASRLHFMEGDERYKFLWGAQPHAVRNIHLWRGARGAALRAMSALHSRLEQARRQRAEKTPPEADAPEAEQDASSEVSH